MIQSGSIWGNSNRFVIVEEIFNGVVIFTWTEKGRLFTGLRCVDVFLETFVPANKCKTCGKYFK